MGQVATPISRRRELFSPPAVPAMAMPSATQAAIAAAPALAVTTASAPAVAGELNAAAFGDSRRLEGTERSRYRGTRTGATKGCGRSQHDCRYGRSIAPLHIITPFSRLELTTAPHERGTIRCPDCFQFPRYNLNII